MKKLILKYLFIAMAVVAISGGNVGVSYADDTANDGNTSSTDLSASANTIVNAGPGPGWHPGGGSPPPPSGGGGWGHGGNGGGNPPPPSGGGSCPTGSFFCGASNSCKPNGSPCP